MLTAIVMQFSRRMRVQEFGIHEINSTAKRMRKSAALSLPKTVRSSEVIALSPFETSLPASSIRVTRAGNTRSFPTLPDWKSSPLWRPDPTSSSTWSRCHLLATANQSGKAFRFLSVTGSFVQFFFARRFLISTACSPSLCRSAYQAARGWFIRRAVMTNALELISSKARPKSRECLSKREKS